MGQLPLRDDKPMSLGGRDLKERRERGESRGRACTRTFMTDNLRSLRRQLVLTPAHRL